MRLPHNSKKSPGPTSVKLTTIENWNGWFAVPGLNVVSPCFTMLADVAEPLRLFFTSARFMVAFEAETCMFPDIII